MREYARYINMLIRRDIVCSHEAGIRNYALIMQFVDFLLCDQRVEILPHFPAVTV